MLESGGEPVAEPLPLGVCGLLDEQGLQAVGHGVEGSRQATHLVAAPQSRAGRQVAGGHRLGHVADPAQGAHHAARYHAGQGGQREHPEHAGQDHHPYGGRPALRGDALVPVGRFLQLDGYGCPTALKSGKARQELAELLRAGPAGGQLDRGAGEVVGLKRHRRQLGAQRCRQGQGGLPLDQPLIGRRRPGDVDAGAGGGGAAQLGDEHVGADALPARLDSGVEDERLTEHRHLGVCLPHLLQAAQADAGDAEHGDAADHDHRQEADAQRRAGGIAQHRASPFRRQDGRPG